MYGSETIYDAMSVLEQYINNHNWRRKIYEIVPLLLEYYPGFENLEDLALGTIAELCLWKVHPLISKHAMQFIWLLNYSHEEEFADWDNPERLMYLWDTLCVIGALVDDKYSILHNSRALKAMLNTAQKLIKFGYKKELD
jgi:hypothetical protein